MLVYDIQCPSCGPRTDVFCRRSDRKTGADGYIRVPCDACDTPSPTRVAPVQTHGIVVGEYDEQIEEYFPTNQSVKDYEKRTGKVANDARSPAYQRFRERARDRAADIRAGRHKAPVVTGPGRVKSATRYTPGQGQRWTR